MKSETTQNGLDFITQFLNPTFVGETIEQLKEDFDVDLSPLSQLGFDTLETSNQ